MAPVSPGGTHNRRPSITRSDYEFLPSALEILEAPPSPLRLGVLFTICALVFATVVWLCLAKLDITATAVGKIQPGGRTKIVQPTEAGRVVSIRVENGSVVRAGDVLIELDPTVAAADRVALEQSRTSLAAEVSARSSVIAWAQRVINDGSADAKAEWAGSREFRLIEAELHRAQATLDNFGSQRAEAEARRKRLVDSIATRTRLLALLKERVDARQVLDQNGQGYRAKVVDALESLERETTVQVNDMGQLAEVEATITSTESKRREVIAQFVSEQSKSLLEAERKLDQVTQDLVKAAHRDERMELRAPVAGVVQQLNVSTIGQVVNAGEALLAVVPLDAEIEVEALVQNRDIGFIQPGQTTIVKVDAFPFTRYGTILGRIVKVSHDAVDQRGTAVTTDAIGTQRGTAPAGNGTPQSLVFPVTVALDAKSIKTERNEIPLSAGMAVTVEIKTGERRAIDYLLSPVREVVESTGHER